MPDEQTKETDTTGNETDSTTKEPEKPQSLYDKTEVMVTRQEEANKKAEEILDRQEKLYANQRLSGTGGGNIPKEPEVSEEKKKANNAAEFFKGSALGDTINKANE